MWPRRLLIVLIVGCAAVLLPAACVRCDRATGAAQRGGRGGAGLPFLDLIDSSRADQCAMSADATLLAHVGVDGEILVRSLATGELLCRLATHRDPVVETEFSPDGALLASIHSSGEVLLWDLATRECWRLASVGGDGSPAYMASWSLGTETVSVGLPGADRGYDLYGSAVSGVAHLLRFSPDGRLLAVGGSGVVVCDVIGGEVRELERPVVSGGHFVFDVAFVAEGDQVASLATALGLPCYSCWHPHASLLRVHEASGGAAAGEPAEPLERRECVPLGLSPDGLFFVGASSAQREGRRPAAPSYGIYRVSDQGLVAALEQPASEDPYGVDPVCQRLGGWVWSADSSLVGACEERHWVGVWDARTGELRSAGRDACDRLLGFTPLGDLLGVRREDACCRIIAVGAEEALQTLPTGSAAGNLLASGRLAEDGRHVYAANLQEAWALATGELAAFEDRPLAPADRVLAVLSGGRSLYWLAPADRGTGGRLGVGRSQADAVPLPGLGDVDPSLLADQPPVTLSRDTSRVVARLPDERLAVWDEIPASGWTEATVVGAGRDRQVRGALALSDDGLTAWTLAEDGALTWWDLADLSSVTTRDLRGAESLYEVSGLKPLPDGTLLLWRYDKAIRIIAPDDAAQAVEVSVPLSAATHLVLSPDRTLAAVSGRGGEVSVVDVATWEARWTRDVTASDASAVARVFTPDNGRVLVNREGVATDVLRASDGSLLATLRPIHRYDKHEWMAVTPDGWWDGSPGIAEVLRWQTPDGIVGEPMTSHRHSPEKVREALAGGG